MNEKERAAKRREKAELEAQREEIKKQAIAHRAEVTSEQLDEMETKLKEVTSLIEEINTDLEKDAADEEKEKEKDRGKGIFGMRAKAMVTQENYRESAQYRDAFYRSLIKREIGAEDAEIMSYGKRAFDDMNGGSVTEGAGYLVPKTTLDEIRTNMMKYGTLYAAITKYTFNGDVTLPIGNVGEPTLNEEKIAELKFSFTEVKISQEAVVATVAVKNLLLKNSIAALESFIAAEVGKYIGAYCDVAVLHSDALSFGGILGKAKTGTYAELDYAKVCEIESEVDSPFGDVAVWIMNRKTFFRKCKAMTDQNGKPLCTALPIMQGNATVGYAFDSYRVILTMAMQDNDIIFGDLSQYIINESQAVVIESDASPEFGKDKTTFRGKVYTGGQVAIPEAFVLYTLDGDKAVMPTATPGAGAVTAGKEIELASTTGKAAIHFTLDGTVPTKDSTKYTAKTKPVINEGCTLKAIATVAGMADSTVLEAAYTIQS